jgi:hypothetical protein
VIFQLLKEGRASKEKQNRARILLKADCEQEGGNWKDLPIAEALYLSVKTVYPIGSKNVSMLHRFRLTL